MKTCPLFALMIAVAGVANGAAFGQDADEVSRPVQPAGEAVEVQLENLNSVDAASEVFLNIFTDTHANTLGVEVAPAGAALRAQLGIEDAGVVVTSVTAESPAAKAGLKQHDVVLKCGDEPVSSPQRFHVLVGGHQGQKTTFHLIRQGKPVEWTVTLPKVPVYDFAEVNLSVNSKPHYRIGVTLAEADETLRNQLKLAAGEGLVVTEVVADSAAAKAGLQRHDVMTKLDNERLTTVEKINSQIQEIKDRQATVVFLRGGEELSRELAPQLSSEQPAVLNVNPWEVKVFQSQNAIDGFVGRKLVGLGDSNSYRLRWVEAYDPATQPSHPANAADQVAALKKQLAEMHKTLESLEAALQPTDPEQEQQDSPK